MVRESLIIILVIFILIIGAYMYTSFYVENEEYVTERKSFSDISGYINKLKTYEMKSECELTKNFELVNDIGDEQNKLDEINRKIDSLNRYFDKTSNVVKENLIKTEQLGDINAKLEFLVSIKKDYECKIAEMNKTLKSMFEDGISGINRLAELNKKIDCMIHISNEKLKHPCIAKEYKIEDDKVGDDLITGKDKEILMDDTSLFVKANSDNYYIPLFKVQS